MAEQNFVVWSIDQVGGDVSCLMHGPDLMLGSGDCGEISAPMACPCSTVGGCCSAPSSRPGGNTCRKEPHYHTDGSTEYRLLL